MIDYLTNKTYRAAAYMRLSIEDENKDEESASIKNQRSFIKEYALKNNIEIYDYYVDDGFSGGNFDRPGFKRMINDIEKGIIDCVITKDMSRLGREFIETGNYVFKYFPEHNIRYIAILENYDTLNPNGVEDILPFKAVINDMYLKDISKKIKSIRHDLMKAGLFVSSSVPYGYKRSEEDNRKLIVDEYAAEVVKKIFNMKEQGVTDGMIARALSDDGILPPDVYKGRNTKTIAITKNLWKPSTVTSLLKNEIYIGTLIQGKYERISLKSKKKKLLPRSKWVIVKNACPAIISEDLFNKINAPKKKKDIRYREYDYLLKGLVTCADCGKPMLVRRVKDSKDLTKVNKTIYVCRTYARYRHGVCSMHYYREDALNEVVLKEVKDVLLRYSNKDELTKKYESSVTKMNLLNKYEKELAVYREKITTIDKAISELYQDRANGIINDEEFFGIKKELENDRRQSADKIADLEIMLGEAKNMLTDEKIKLKYINDFLQAEVPDKQTINTLVNRIEIGEDKKVNIYFNFNVNEVTNEC